MSVARLDYRQHYTNLQSSDVAPTELVFTTETPDRVSIEVMVRNFGTEPSAPTHALVYAAPLGAFVRWRGLTSFEVPALEPGESATLATEARRVRRPPLGPPNKVRAGALLTALDASDESPASRVVRPGVAATLVASASFALPASPFDLLGGSTPHWAGNLNVFVGRRSIEKHQAMALRVEPGCVNRAFFVVGSGKDEYSFELSGPVDMWRATLAHVNPRHRLDGRVSRIEPDAWLPVDSHAMVVLELVPPAGCEAGKITVHVRQKSTGKRASVEFGFDPQAAGAGCYTL